MRPRCGPSITALSTPNYDRDPFVSTFDSTTLGLPKYMYDNATLQRFPMFSAGRLYRLWHTGLLEDGPPGRRAPVLGFDDENEGRATISRRAPNTGTTGSTIRSPGIHPGHFAFGAADHQPGSERRHQPAGQRLRIDAARLGQRLQLPHRSQGVFPRADYWGFFVQDDWKVSRKLTLNLGLRYEFDVPRTEVLNRYSYWDLNAPAPISVPGYNLKGVTSSSDNNTRSPFDRDRNNFAPRLGFAYALNTKTSIRAGAGIFYTLSRATVAGHTGSPFNTDSGMTVVRWTAAPPSMPSCPTLIRTG